MRFLVTAPAAFALGSATFTPVREEISDSTMAVEVTMKMMSRTKNTSVSGVMLISATTVSLTSGSLSPALASSICTLIPIGGIYEGGAFFSVGGAAAPATAGGISRVFAYSPSTSRNSSQKTLYSTAMAPTRATK